MSQAELFKCKAENGGCDGFIDPNNISKQRYIRGNRRVSSIAVPCGRCMAFHWIDTQELTQLHGEDRNTAYATLEGNVVYR